MSAGRRCPRCTFTLVPQQRNDVTVDVCPRCQGAFFDAGEARALLGENAEPSTWERTSAARFVGRRRLLCPAGHGRLTAYALKAPPETGTEVEVDVCPVCLGMWLDAWEGARLAQATRDLARSGAVPAGDKRTGAGWYAFQLLTSLPVEEYQPVRRRPLVCYALIAACTVVFVLELASRSPEAFTRLYGVVPSDLLAGRHRWSVVTHMFLHGGVAHLAFNMYFLYTFGDNVEDRVGRLRFLVLYLVFGLCAMTSQLIFSLDSDLPLLGASGAIAGVMGAYLVLFPRARVYQVLFFIRFKVPVWFYLLAWLGLQAWWGFHELQVHQTGGVAWWAHVGGFAAGALWGALNRHKYADGAELSAAAPPVA